MAVSLNGVFLVAGTGQGNCYIWRSENGLSDNYIPMQELQAHPDNYILKCHFSSDSQFLATCSSDKTCKVFQLCEVANEPEEDEMFSSE
jgi:target of rapamycin complex subunit LST8